MADKRGLQVPGMQKGKTFIFRQSEDVAIIVQTTNYPLRGLFFGAVVNVSHFPWVLGPPLILISEYGVVNSYYPSVAGRFTVLTLHANKCTADRDLFRFFCFFISLLPAKWPYTRLTDCLAQL